MPYKILWIEDDATVLRSMVKLLKDEGALITTIRTLSEYSELSEEEWEKYDLAIIDLLLPPGSSEAPEYEEIGISIIRNIRQSRKSDMPIIAVTGLSDIDFESANLEQFAPLSILKKAVLPSELYREVHGFLE